MALCMTRWLSSLTLLCAALAPLEVCGQASASAASTQPSSATPQLTDGEIARFDALTSLSTILADAVHRRKYLAHLAVSEGGRRTYAFELRPQAGMTPGRHFQLITITWARADERPDRSSVPAVASSGGPGGSITDAAARTNDQCFDLRVSLATLLPNAADAADIDPGQVARSLIRDYAAVAAPCFKSSQFPL
jgi:hypothetical protein